MFYPTYDDYMRDVFYFNGLASPNRDVYSGANTYEQQGLNIPQIGYAQYNNFEPRI